tara:strand:+ start:4212 stop:5039 length:828 start_codon:yes stop_codon:yes gene_type:complete
MRYQYSSSGFRKHYNYSPMIIPDGVKILLIINFLVFLCTELSGNKHLIFSSFGIIPSMVISQFSIWQLFTYLFIHGGFLHIIFNMFVLWMFGKELEKKWGQKIFLKFYFLCGIGSGLITVIIGPTSNIPIVGASGAIYGLLVAYGFIYPNQLIYLYGLFPLKVKHMVFGLGIISFFAIMSSNSTNISHITHLSGMFIGFILINNNFHNFSFNIWKYKSKMNNKIFSDSKRMTNIKYKVDVILDKANKEGWESLTKEEAAFLNDASKEIFNNKDPD